MKWLKLGVGEPNGIFDFATSVIYLFVYCLSSHEDSLREINKAIFVCFRLLSLFYEPSIGLMSLSSNVIAATCSTQQHSIHLLFDSAAFNRHCCFSEVG